MLGARHKTIAPKSGGAGHARITPTLGLLLLNSCVLPTTKSPDARLSCFHTGRRAARLSPSSPRRFSPPHRAVNHQCLCPLTPPSPRSRRRRRCLGFALSTNPPSTRNPDTSPVARSRYLLFNNAVIGVIAQDTTPPTTEFQSSITSVQKKTSSRSRR